MKTITINRIELEQLIFDVLSSKKKAFPLIGEAILSDLFSDIAEMAVDEIFEYQSDDIFYDDDDDDDDFLIDFDFDEDEFDEDEDEDDFDDEDFFFDDEEEDEFFDDEDEEDEDFDSLIQPVRLRIVENDSD